MLDQYAYTLPPELVAHSPAEPRDTARLFVYNTVTDTVTHDHFYNLATYIPGVLLVRNDTRVVPARLVAVANGEPIELFVLYDRGVSVDGVVEGLVNRGVPIGAELSVGDYTFTVIDNTQKQMRLRLGFSPEQLLPLLQEHGQTPLPPYIRTDLSERARRERYQTVFAAEAGSVAAPTASLHFTERVADRLQAAAVETVSVTLNVGLGTFAPIFPENFTAGRLHQERYTVPGATADLIATAKRTNRPVCAAGTTVVRTVEASKQHTLAGVGSAGETDLFIYPPYDFTVPDMLLTNFHVPRSSLLCLVDAFLIHKHAPRGVMDLYWEAIAERYRFYSFGDAMLIM